MSETRLEHFLKNNSLSQYVFLSNIEYQNALKEKKKRFYTVLNSSLNDFIWSRTKIPCTRFSKKACIVLTLPSGNWALPSGRWIEMGGFIPPPYKEKYLAFKHH